MNKCTVPSGSSTAKWLATATRFHSTQTLHKVTKLRGTCWFLIPNTPGHRGLSSTRPQKAWLPGARDDGSEAAPDALLKESINTPLTTGRVEATKEWKSKAAESQPVRGSCQPNVTSPLEVLTAEGSAIFKGLRSHNVNAASKRRSLPISPLMHPAFLEARHEPKVRKPSPAKGPTEFQQQLAKNPYALALGTPVRKCAITNTRLPAYFLQDFMVMAEPKTGTPWYVPVSLANQYLPATELAAEEIEDESGLAIETESLQSSKVGYKAYTLNSKIILQAMQDPTSGYGHNQKKKGRVEFVPSNFVPVKMRGSKAAMNTYGKARWRPDMDEFIPELMSRRVVSAFVHLMGLKRGYLVGCSDWDDAMKKPQVAAFLWMGKNGGEETEGPHEFAALDMGTQSYDKVGSQLGRKKYKVPVYNLPTILGEERLSKLRKLVPDGEVVVLKHKNATVKLQSMLWKMQGYTAEHQWADEDEALRRTKNARRAQVVDEPFRLNKEAHETSK